MRWTFLSRALALSFVGLSLAAAAPKSAVAEVEKDAFGEPIEPSTYNGKEVPPFLELDGTDFETIIAKGYWYELAAWLVS